MRWWFLSDSLRLPVYLADPIRRRWKRAPIWGLQGRRPPGSCCPKGYSSGHPQAWPSRRAWRRSTARCSGPGPRWPTSTSTSSTARSTPSTRRCWPATSTPSSATTCRRWPSSSATTSIISMPPHDLWLEGPDDVSAGWTAPATSARARSSSPVVGQRHRRVRQLQEGPGPLGALGAPGHRGQGRQDLRPPQLPVPRALRRVRAAAVHRGVAPGSHPNPSAIPIRLEQLAQLRPALADPDAPAEPSGARAGA